MGEIKLRVRFNKEHERAGTSVSLKDGKQIVVKFQGFTPEKKL